MNVPNSVTETLPSGALTTSPTGVARVEPPAVEDPIADQIGPDPSTVRAVLDTAFGWLASFQRAYRGEDVVRSPEYSRGRAELPELGLNDLPTVDSPVASFVAPCHGDFHPWNVYASGDDVTTVIDWEYATCQGDPAVDPAQFLLFVCAIVGDDFETGFESLCSSDTPYSTAVRKSLDRYCDRVGLSRRAVIGAIPYAHIHPLKTLLEQCGLSACRGLYSAYESRFETITAEFDSAVSTLG